MIEAVIEKNEQSYQTIPHEQTTGSISSLETYLQKSMAYIQYYDQKKTYALERNKNYTVILKSTHPSGLDKDLEKNELANERHTI